MGKCRLILLVLYISFLLLPALPMAEGKGSETKKPAGPNICFKSSTHSWRETKDFDVVKYLSGKLIRGGFRVVKDDCRDCPFTLEVAYSEVAGKPFSRENTGKGTYTTDIELSLRLTRGDENLWSKLFQEVSVEPNIVGLMCPPYCSEKDFHREAVNMLKGEIEIEYLDHFLGIKIGTSPRTETEIIMLGLKDRNPSVVESAGRAAHANGPEPTLLEPLFGAFLRADLVQINSWVAKSINRYQDEQIAERIISILDRDRNEYVQARAAWFLGCRKLSKAAPVLLKTVKIGPVLACLEAVDALMRINNKEFLKDLETAEKRSGCGYYIHQTLTQISHYNPLSPCM
jgi:hypothetical protein